MLGGILRISDLSRIGFRQSLRRVTPSAACRKSGLSELIGNAESPLPAGRIDTVALFGR